MLNLCPNWFVFGYDYCPSYLTIFIFDFLYFLLQAELMVLGTKPLKLFQVPFAVLIAHFFVNKLCRICRHLSAQKSCIMLKFPNLSIV